MLSIAAFLVLLFAMFAWFAYVAYRDPAGIFKPKVRAPERSRRDDDGSVITSVSHGSGKQSSSDNFDGDSGGDGGSD